VNAVDVLSVLASRVVETTVVGGLLALAVWGLCRLVPAIPPAVRCWLWWGVALKMLLGLLPLPAVAVPLLPARDAATVRPSLDAVARASVDSRGGAQRGAHSAGAGAAIATTPKTAARDDGSRMPLDTSPAAWTGAAPLRSLPWQVPLAALWLVGVAIELARAGAHLLRARRVVRAAEPVADPSLVATFDELRRRLDVPNAELRISRSAATPQVVGVRRPVVLLPVGKYERLDADELAMALGHELLHVRRADLPLGLVPALAARCFFFHPLARLVEREHALAREEACDAAVVARLAPSPRAYGHLLLELALGCGAPLRAAAAAVTHPTLQRRLQMLLQPACTLRPAFVAPLLLLGVCALVPLRVIAREEASAARTAAPAAPARAAEPVPATEPARTAEPRPDGEPTTAAESVFNGDPATVAAESAAADPVVAVAPLARLAMAGTREEHVINHYERNEHDAWIYFQNDKSSTMSGSSDDIAVARRYQHGAEPLFWTRRGEQEWVVRDPAFLERVDELYAPVRELGAKQAELGGKQAELGAKQAEMGAHQAELGAQQAALGSQQANLSVQMAKLSAQQAALSARRYAADDGERTALENQQREIERSERDLERQANQLSEQQNELSRRQSEWGDRQNELGGKQNELGGLQNELGGRMQQASEEAEQAVMKLLDEAIRSGIATRVP
jgi:beta-lactamase regulating signal transducer with metallopeptidase domain